MVPLSMLSALGLILIQKYLSLVFNSKQACFTLCHPCLSLSLDVGAGVSCKKFTLFRFMLQLIQMHCVGHCQRESGDVTNFPGGSLRERVSLLSEARSHQHLTRKK